MCLTSIALSAKFDIDPRAQPKMVIQSSATQLFELTKPSILWEFLHMHKGCLHYVYFDDAMEFSC